MELTSLQKDYIKKLAAADVRDESTMLGLLLLEGIRFFYCDNEPINTINLWRIKSQCIKRNG
jgi:hypothetical protein